MDKDWELAGEGLPGQPELRAGSFRNRVYQLLPEMAKLPVSAEINRKAAEVDPVLAKLNAYAAAPVHETEFLKEHAHRHQQVDRGMWGKKQRPLQRPELLSPELSLIPEERMIGNLNHEVTCYFDGDGRLQ